MLSKLAQRALIGWDSRSPRNITASFRKQKRINMNVVQCYAQTNDSNDKIKDQFYYRLQTVIEALSGTDLNIVKVASATGGFEEAMGQQGLGLNDE